MNHRINGRILRAVVLALCLTLGLTPLVGAAERLDHSRALPKATGFFAPPSAGGAPGLPGIEIQGLKAGKPEAGGARKRAKPALTAAEVRKVKQIAESLKGDPDITEPFAVATATVKRMRRTGRGR